MAVGVEGNNPVTEGVSSGFPLAVVHPGNKERDTESRDLAHDVYGLEPFFPKGGVQPFLESEHAAVVNAGEPLGDESPF